VARMPQHFLCSLLLPEPECHICLAVVTGSLWRAATSIHKRNLKDVAGLCPMRIWCSCRARSPRYLRLRT
jgi:hypothetical protein